MPNPFNEIAALFMQKRREQERQQFADRSSVHASYGQGFLMPIGNPLGSPVMQASRGSGGALMRPPEELAMAGADQAIIDRALANLSVPAGFSIGIPSASLPQGQATAPMPDVLRVSNQNTSNTNNPMINGVKL